MEIAHIHERHGGHMQNLILAVFLAMFCVSCGPGQDKQEQEETPIEFHKGRDASTGAGSGG